MTPGERIRVMVVDDHLIVREGLTQVLEQSGEFEVVGQAADGEEAVRVAAWASPDVVLMDVIMPNKDGVEACREILETSPEIRVVMLTASSEEAAVVESVAAGAMGYLQKETGRERLLDVMRAVFMGEHRVPADVVRRVFSELRGAPRTGYAAEEAALTQREREILIAFARGMSYRRIAEDRGVRPVTIRNAVYRIQEKLGVESMQGLVLWAVRHGLIDSYAADG